jgi:hypothetical protein
MIKTMYDRRRSEEILFREEEPCGQGIKASTEFHEVEEKKYQEI